LVGPGDTGVVGEGVGVGLGVGLERSHDVDTASVAITTIVSRCGFIRE
jgi:hypothetical protein